MKIPYSDSYLALAAACEKRILLLDGAFRNHGAASASHGIGFPRRYARIIRGSQGR